MARQEIVCADCGGWDIEWMRQCSKHKGVEFCRGCECPYCAEEAMDDYEDAGPLDLEDQLECALNMALPVGKSSNEGKT